MTTLRGKGALKNVNGRYFLQVSSSTGNWSTDTATNQAFFEAFTGASVWVAGGCVALSLCPLRLGRR